MVTMNSVFRFVSNDFTLRAASVDSTEAVREMQRLQGTGPLATLGVGRAMTGALLLASHLKEGQEVGLLFKGNGPLGSIYAEASFTGHVRGYCPHPEYISPTPEDQLKLGKAMGFGTLNVARHQPFQRQAYQGMVDMVSGEVGDDIAHYLHQSHQIRSLISVGVYLDEYGQVKAAGGILIEVMPGVEDQVVELIEKNSQEIKTPVSQLLFEGKSPIQILEPYMKGVVYTQIPHDFPVSYFCPCDAARVMRALTTFGEAGLQEIIDDNQPTEVICQVCGRKYEVSVDEVKSLKDEVHRKSLH